jgi:hypothetical protein
MDNIVLEDAFTFYVCNPNLARELLQQTEAFKAALSGQRDEFTDAELGNMAISAASEQLSAPPFQGDYREEYEAARDALKSLDRNSLGFTIS